MPTFVAKVTDDGCSSFDAQFCKIVVEHCSIIEVCAFCPGSFNAILIIMRSLLDCQLNHMLHRALP